MTTTTPKTTPPTPCLRCGRLVGSLVNGRYEPRWTSKRWGRQGDFCSACDIAGANGEAWQTTREERKP
jgi:hypothetical protein